MTWQRILISLTVMFAASILQLVLTVTARRDSSAASTGHIFEWQDADLWADWINNAILAFGILALKNGAELKSSQVGILLGCLVIGLAIIPNYVRWYGTDPATGNLYKYRGLLASNAMSIFLLVAALIAGVDLYS